MCGVGRGERGGGRGSEKKKDVRWFFSIEWAQVASLLHLEELSDVPFAMPLDSLLQGRTSSPKKSPAQSAKRTASTVSLREAIVE